MSLKVKTLYVLAVALLALGPALTLPALSAHRPTVSAPAQGAPRSPLGAPLAPMVPLLGMSIHVKDAATVAAKWKTRASAAQNDFVTAAANAGGAMEANAIAADAVYRDAVTQAAAKGRYKAGLMGSGAKYTKNVTAVGGTRFAQGVANGQDAMAQGIAPVLQTIAGLTLPVRGVKGTNQERSNIVATALRKMKVGA